MRNKEQKVPLYRVGSSLGLLVFFYGLFFTSSMKYWGKPVYFWVCWSGLILLVFSLSVGVARVVSQRMNRSSDSASS